MSRLHYYPNPDDKDSEFGQELMAVYGRECELNWDSQVTRTCRGEAFGILVDGVRYVAWPEELIASA